jgi:integrase
VWLLDFVDAEGRRRRVSVGHADKGKAERQRAQKERELRMGVVGLVSMRLSDFVEDNLARTGSQIRESTQVGQRGAMRDFIKVVGDINYTRVTLKHAELFRQTCLDKGNSPATVSKKLRALKSLFQRALERKQLDENPLRYVKLPRWSKRKIQVYKPQETERLLRVAKEYSGPVRWDLLIAIALKTGMRRGELLNLAWRDIDFEAWTIDVAPKDDTPETWQWLIKDTERRTLPLTKNVVTALTEHHTQQPEKHPYVFVPPYRYAKIQQLRKEGRWTSSDSSLKVLNNFKRDFDRLLAGASIQRKRFHDLRNTALTNWLAAGLSEYEVMRLAGHSDFNTTHRFYLAVSDNLLGRARQAAEIGARLARAPDF